jgi:carbamoyltransferase
VHIVGLSAFYHQSACCLLSDGKLVAAAEEERFSRVKHDPRLPVAAFRFCLAAGGIGIDRLDAVAYYEDPVAKLSRQLGSRLWEREGEPADPRDLPWLDPLRPERTIRERLGWDGPLLTFAHHRSHAASSFYFSGFPEASILTVDGVGEWATTTYGRARRSRRDGEEPGLELFEEVRFPHSLGLLYSTITAYLGFRVNGGEYKVMGLAAYGEPRYASAVRRLVRSHAGGGYELDLDFFDFVRGRRMDAPALWELFEGPPRRPGGEITRRHRDVAASVQRVLEEILLEKVRHLHRRAPSANLCMAGGVALNCVAVGRIVREGPFEKVFVQPAAGDAGGALGAAALASCQLAGRPPSAEPLRHVFLGPRWSGDEVGELLNALGLPASDFRRCPDAIAEEAARRLATGQVVGWFQGAMELGPRALGGRSILANPMDPDVRDRLNRSVKRREGFRPFAPAVLAERAGDHFDLDRPSPFMTETCRVASPLDLPAVTHVDGSARPQTVDRETCPRFARLLEAYERRTGCPVLLNTSLNVRGEPIVCSPVDALFTLADAGLDALVIEDFLLDRRELPEGMAATLAAWRPSPGGRGTESAVHETLYTFV